MKLYVSSKTGKINMRWGGKKEVSKLIFPTPCQFSLEDQTEVCFMLNSWNTNYNISLHSNLMLLVVVSVQSRNIL